MNKEHKYKDKHKHKHKDNDKDKDAEIITESLSEPVKNVLADFAR